MQAINVIARYFSVPKQCSGKAAINFSCKWHLYQVFIYLDRSPEFDKDMVYVVILCAET